MHLRPIVAMALILGTSAGLIAADSAPPPATAGGTITISQAQLQQMIHDEVARQLQEVIRDANARSRGPALVSTVQSIRSQVELYRIQHEDKAPTFARMANWNALMTATKTTGEPGGSWGPYLTRTPINPYSGSSAICSANALNPKCGWSYDENTGNVKAIVNSNVGLPADLVDIVPLR